MMKTSVDLPPKDAAARSDLEQRIVKLRAGAYIDELSRLRRIVCSACRRLVEIAGDRAALDDDVVGLIDGFVHLEKTACKTCGRLVGVGFVRAYLAAAAINADNANSLDLELLLREYAYEDLTLFEMLNPLQREQDDCRNPDRASRPIQAANPPMLKAEFREVQSL